MATNTRQLAIDFGFDSKAGSNVAGDLTLTGAISANSYTGNATFLTDIVPNTAGTRSLGNTTNRWIINANNITSNGVITVSGNVTSNGLLIGTIGAANGLLSNSSTIVVGNSSVNTTITGSTATLGSTLTVAGNTTIQGAAHTITGNTTFDTNVLHVDGFNNRVGVLTTTPSVALDVVGTIKSSVSVNSAVLSVGTNIIANSVGLQTTGYINANTLSLQNTSVTGWTANITGIYSSSNKELGSVVYPWNLWANTGSFAANVTIKQLVANGTIGTEGQVLTSKGTSDLYWSVPQLNITDDTVNNVTRYLTFVAPTSGLTATNYVSSTKLTFNPGSGTLSATIFSSTSDERDKENIRDIENPERVLQLDGKLFNFKDNPNPTAGLIAQRVLEQIPEAVISDGSWTNKLSINYDVIVAYLLEVIKKQEDRITALESK